MVSASIIVNFSYPTIDYYLPFQIDEFLRFNDSDLTISQWDSTFRRFAEGFYWVLENTPILQQIATEDGVTITPDSNVTHVLAHHTIMDVCKIHEEYCTGDNKQYSS